MMRKMAYSNLAITSLERSTDSNWSSPVTPSREKARCGVIFSKLKTDIIRIRLGWYVHTIPGIVCAGAKTIPDRASVHT